MTEANRRPATGDHSNVPPTPARHQAPQMRITNDTTADPVEIANRALQGLSPATESWFATSKADTTPEPARPRHTPSALPPPRPVYRLPSAPHTQPPRYAYQPSPYAAQQRHPAGPVMFANPAMPSYAAAQVPTRNSSTADQDPAPARRSRNKKAVLLPLAAMAIASAGVGAFAQSNLGTDLEDQPQQVTAHAGQYDAVPVVDTGNQKVIDAPGVIAPETTSPFSPASARTTSGGKHSNGDYDAPSTAETYGGTHASSRTLSAPNREGVSADPAPAPKPAPAPAPAPQPAPEPTPAPEPAPEPAPAPGPAQPTLTKNVVEPVLDTVTGVVDALTGIKIDLTP